MDLAGVVFPHIAQNATTIAMVHVLCCAGLGLTGLLSDQPELIVAFLCVAGAIGSYLWIRWVDKNNDGRTTHATCLFVAT
jgi:hypothetical protein